MALIHNLVNWYNFDNNKRYLVRWAGRTDNRAKKYEDTYNPLYFFWKANILIVIFIVLFPPQIIVYLLYWIKFIHYTYKFNLNDLPDAPLVGIKNIELWCDDNKVDYFQFFLLTTGDIFLFNIHFRNNLYYRCFKSYEDAIQFN